MADLKKGSTGLRRVVNALGYSISGLKAAYFSEQAFRQELLLAIVLVPLAFFLEASGTGRALLVASVMLVLVIELLNSAVEAVVDRISFERHELAKFAKDVGSAAVLLTLINLVVVWGLVLLG